MVVHIGNHQAIGISPTPIEFIEEQKLFISDSEGARPLVSSCSFTPFSATMKENERGGPRNMSSRTTK